MLHNLNDDVIHALLPHIAKPARGESGIYDKLLPFLEGANIWLHEAVLGHDFSLAYDQPLYKLGQKIVVYQAMADAIPSLDLALTGSGFTVSNSEGRAPASKERVERLIESLRASVASNLIVFQKHLFNDADWVNTDAYRYFIDTALHTFADTEPLRRKYNLGAVDVAHTQITMYAADFEAEAARLLFGKFFIEYMRACLLDPKWQPVVTAFKRAELTYIDSILAGARYPFADIRQLLAPVVFALDYVPEAKRRWLESTDSPTSQDFKNDTKGAFFF